MPIVEVTTYRVLLHPPDAYDPYTYRAELDPALYYAEFTEDDLDRQRPRWDLFIRNVSRELLLQFVRDLYEE